MPSGHRAGTSRDTINFRKVAVVGEGKRHPMTALRECIAMPTSGIRQACRTYEVPVIYLYHSMRGMKLAREKSCIGHGAAQWVLTGTRWRE